jgi:hypothetical protein
MTRYSAVLRALEAPANYLLQNNGKATVSDLLALAPEYGIELPDHRARSVLGQVFRRIGAKNIGTEPARRDGAKGVRQVIWSWDSPYRGS